MVSYSHFTCFSTLTTRPNILRSSVVSFSAVFFSRFFLSVVICPFPRIWSTLWKKLETIRIPENGEIVEVSTVHIYWKLQLQQLFNSFWKMPKKKDGFIFVKIIVIKVHKNTIKECGMMFKASGESKMWS